jgi:uncharacterized protein YjbI with pentapeptide repeats
MKTQLAPIESWRSRTGLELLLRLGRRELPPAPTLRDLGLPDWERAILRRALRAPRGFASEGLGPRRQASLARSLAEELDMWRAMAARRRARLPVDQTKFIGKAGHLDLLGRSLLSPTDDNEWNRWRARSARNVPDLRGANLADLDLDTLRLRHARLAGANLSGSSLRLAKLDRADLRRARLFGTDLSYSSLRKAKLAGAWIQDARLTDAQLQGADLRDARIIGCILNRANLLGADLRGVLFWGTSVWQVERDKTTKQTGLSIGSDLFDPADIGDMEPRSPRAPHDRARVDDIVVAEFLSHINHNRANMASILNAASHNLVLLLGRFRGKQKNVLVALEGALLSLGYVPMVFDFEEPQERDLVETVAILAGLSRFVVADLTHPRSTPLESHLIIPDMAVPFVPIIRKGEKPFSMFFSLQRKYPWVMQLVTYASEASLVRRLQERIVDPAEALARRLRRMKHPGAGG